MFHKTNLGAYGENLTADMNGYVPEATDGPWDFTLDHTERTHDDAGNLTEYGQWWEDEGYPEWRDAAVAATRQATEALGRWQDRNA